MKKIIIAIILLITAAKFSDAQNINWRSLGEEQQNLVHLNFGYDFGVTTQFGYSRAIKAFKPTLLTIDYSFPMGKNLTDDFKVRYGGQIELFEKNKFSVTAKIMGIFRRYHTELVRIVSFGSEFSAVAGYYKPSWYVAGELGFDKSINSHLKHADVIKDNYIGTTDGWYMPSGGNYFYGIQAGKTLSQTVDISLRIGATNAQGKDEDAIIPLYLQLGLSKKF